MSDRSTALLAELQTVCQRILANESQGAWSPAPVAAATPVAVANATSVANSLEALRRQAAENHDQLAELKRSVDAHRGVVAGDSAANGQMLVDLRRSVRAMTEAVEEGRREQEVQSKELVTSIEALRVGLTGFGASHRQQTSELRASVESLDRTVSGFANQVQNALNALGEQIQTALSTLSQQIATALRNATTEQGEALGRQGAAYEALRHELEQMRMDERLDELELLLSIGLPKFSEEIQAGLQQSLKELSRAFRLTEREHGNRMVELHRAFDSSLRRLEASVQPRERHQTAS